MLRLSLTPQIYRSNQCIRLYFAVKPTHPAIIALIGYDLLLQKTLDTIAGKKPRDSGRKMFNNLIIDKVLFVSGMSQNVTSRKIKRWVMNVVSGINADPRGSFGFCIMNSNRKQTAIAVTQLAGSCDPPRKQVEFSEPFLYFVWLPTPSIVNKNTPSPPWGSSNH